MKTRGPIFETNSSSAHTLIVPKKAVQHTQLEIPGQYIGRDVIIHTGEYGWGYAILRDWERKAEYIATFARMQGSKKEEAFCKKMKEWLKATSVTIEGEGYIDHQSMQFAENCYRLAKRVIFRPDFRIMITNDNGPADPPKGWEEKYYEN